MPQASIQQDWEFIKVIITALALFVPTVLSGISTYLLYRASLGVEKSKQLNQELVKRRLKFYDDVAPSLNRLYCFYSAVGDWHDLNPEEIIKIKRCVDKEFHMYKYIFTDDVFESYKAFISLYFFEFSQDGKPAKLRPDRKYLKRLMHEYYDDRWERSFDCGCRCPPREYHHKSYIDLMDRLANNVKGVASAPLSPLPPLPQSAATRCSCST